MLNASISLSVNIDRLEAEEAQSPLEQPNTKEIIDKQASSDLISFVIFYSREFLEDEDSACCSVTPTWTGLELDLFTLYNQNPFF